MDPTPTPTPGPAPTPPPSPQPNPAPAGTRSSAALLARLEALSQARPDRVLRLRGRLPQAESASATESEIETLSAPAAAAHSGEGFELVIFRGFSSSTTHPTAFDPDQPALAEGALITAAELLQGPLRPGAEQVLAGPQPVEAFLEPEGWR